MKLVPLFSLIIIAFITVEAIAKTKLTDNVIISYGDIIFEKKILEQLK